MAPNERTPEHPEPTDPRASRGGGLPWSKSGARARQAEHLRRLRNRRWGRTMALSLAVAVGGGLLVSDALLPDCEHEGCPAVERLRSYRPPEPPKIMDASGELAGQLHGPKRIVVGLDSMSLWMT